MSNTEKLLNELISRAQTELTEEDIHAQKIYEALVKVSLCDGIPNAEKAKLDLLIKQYNYLLICMIHARSMT